MRSGPVATAGASPGLFLGFLLLVPVLAGCIGGDDPPTLTQSQSTTRLSTRTTTTLTVTATTTVTETPSPPPTRFGLLSANKTFVSVPHNISFRFDAALKDPTTLWTLNFGDGNFTEGNVTKLPGQLNHTYRKHGNTTVWFNVTYGDGFKAFTKLNLLLIRPPVAKLYFNDTISVPYAPGIFTGATTEDTIRTGIESDRGGGQVPHNGTYMRYYVVKIVDNATRMDITTRPGDADGSVTLDVDIYCITPDDQMLDGTNDGDAEESLTIEAPKPGNYTVVVFMTAGANAAVDTLVATRYRVPGLQ